MWGIDRACASAALAAIVASASPAGAETLQDAWTRAYQTNPTIQAARARLRATEELKPQARAAGLPQISATGLYENSSVDQTVNDAAFSEDEAATSELRSFDLDTLTGRVDGELAVFTGLRNFNAIRQARARIEAGGAALAAVEQNVLARVAAAYFDVVRDQKIYDATAQNVRVLLKQQRDTERLFAVGDVTRTDVAQAGARLDGAKADLTNAQARLEISRLTYKELTGETPDTLDPNPTAPEAPETLDAALRIADDYAPRVVAARANEEAARRGVAIAKSAFAPQVSLTTRYEISEDPSSFVLDEDEFSFGVRATVPLFLGGQNFSRVREAKALNDEARRLIVEAERRTAAEVAANWRLLEAARANTTTAASQLNANDEALNGVRREAQLGRRTTLDILDAEGERLASAVALAEAERDARVATIDVLASAGVLVRDAGAAAE